MSYLHSYQKGAIFFQRHKLFYTTTKGDIESLNDTPITFNIADHEESIDDIQSTISTLREALDSFNSGTMTESAVLDLMQQFPALIPYIDLAADGFGNLSEGLSVLIAQQPDSLIGELERLKQSLNTEEERAQVDALINSLQSLSSYGDTGMEAYATAIGSTWTDTANVIQSVTDQFENLAKVQEAVADGLTISTSAAAELAQMYPEILTNAIYAGNGQIQLNEEVVKSILAGDESIINAQITKLEADKAELEAKKSYAEAQLEMLKQVGEGEGQISKEVAQYRLDIANSLLQKLIDAGMEEDKAYAAVAANMAGNMQEYNRIVGEVAENSSANMNKSAISMAVGIDVNSKNAQVSINGILEAAQQAALAVAGIKDGEQRGKKDKINSALDDAKGKGSKSAEETKDEFEEIVDFFERRVKVLDNALALLKTNLDNVVGSGAKNNLIDAELGITEEKFKNYSDALNMYTQKANEALCKLPSDIAAKVKDGAVDLTTFIGDGNEEVVEAIKDYEQWADKVADCKQELAELRTAIRQLELEKFNNIMEDFTNQFDLHEDGKGLIEKQIALLKEAGELIGESFFTTQIDQSKKQLAILEEEKAKLVDQMTSAVSSGRVQKASDEWLSMVNSISDVEGSILDCKKAIEEFDNSLLELHDQIFLRIQKEFGNINDELSNLQGLFEDFKVTDGNFNWSKEGLAQLGLLTQQYELAQYQVQQYNDAIAELNAAYGAGKYSATEYVDKLSELSSEQWDAVNSSEAIKDAIIDLNETRINEEIDAIEDAIKKHKELTDSLIANLEAERALHDYKKSIEEKASDLTDLDRQIAAVQNDTSAAGIARLKLLQDQRKKTADELSELEYDHSIEAQKDALNKQYDQYEEERNKEIEALKASLEERETLIAESFETVKANANVVGQEIAAIAIQHGITISDAIITSWQNGENAIASYGTVLSEGTSAFIGNIMGVEDEVYVLQAKANETADTLSYMFATRADTLVGELAASYNSEENLAYMTQALHDSLINTLEGGYNISSIMSALDGIAGGLNNVASAANNATSAMAAMGAAQDDLNRKIDTAPTSGYGDKVPTGLGTAIASAAAINELKKKKSSASSSSSKSASAKGITQYVNRYAKGGVVKKNKKNPLNPIAESMGEDTMVAAREGEVILNEEQLKALKDYAIANGGAEKDGIIYFTPIDVQSNGHTPALKDLPFAPQNIVQSNPEMLTKQPEFEKTNVRNNNVTMHYDSLITLNGDVNDTNHFLNGMRKVAREEVEKSWHEATLNLKYGIY